MLRKVLYVLLAAIVLIQFFPPSKNDGAAWGAEDISTVYATPPGIRAILDRSCNDCHSNHTNYPWYTYIQPAGWWMQHHVNEGIRELNFSKFATYKEKRQRHKVKECIEMIGSGEMPLGSYTWMHKEAELSETDKAVLLTWLEQLPGEQ